MKVIALFFHFPSFGGWSGGSATKINAAKKINGTSQVYPQPGLKLSILFR